MEDDDDVEKKEDDDVEEEDRSQDQDSHFARACAVEMHVNISQDATFYGHLQVKCCRPELAQKADPHFAEPAQSKCTSTFHKSHFIWKITGKMPQTRMSPERRPTLCASLRSRNARQHFTRATLYGKLQVKCRRPE